MRMNPKCTQAMGARVQEIHLERKMFFFTWHNSELVIIASVFSKKYTSGVIIKDLT